jgi:hypothetical protein
MRQACHFALLMQIDFSARGQGRWNVMWRRLLWPGKPRWIVISRFSPSAGPRYSARAPSNAMMGRIVDMAGGC